MHYGKLQIEKFYWTTKEVSELTGVPDYTLKYWEKVVPYLQVPRNRAKNRAWRKQDIEFVKALKCMLENPREYLDSEKKSPLHEIDKNELLKNARQVENPTPLPEILSGEPLVEDSALFACDNSYVVDKFDRLFAEKDAQTCKNEDFPAQNVPGTAQSAAENTPSLVDKIEETKDPRKKISVPNQHKPNPEVLRKLRAELLEAMAKLKG